MNKYPDELTIDAYNEWMRDDLIVKDHDLYNEQMNDYIRLNFQRAKRLLKTTELNEELVQLVEDIDRDQNWLMIAEPWCGDVVHLLPILKKMEELNSHVKVKIVLRDQNLDLMDQHLTNGGRSIPKVIVSDQDSPTLFTWGPRSKNATDYLTKLNNDSTINKDQAKMLLQKWYNQDKGISIQEELINLIKNGN